MMHLACRALNWIAEPTVHAGLSEEGAAAPSATSNCRGAIVAVVVAGAIIGVWLTAGPQLAATPRLVLLLVALVAQLIAVLTVQRQGVSSRLVIVVGAVLLVLAVALPPQGSNDLWAYAMQGRIISAHHANPYLHKPTEYLSDPALQRVARGWRHAANPYGPVSATLEAGFAWIAGGSVLVTRILFQGIEALGVVAIVLALRRRADGAAAVAFIMLSPAVLASVNGGHNDVLVGAAIHAAVILADRRRLVAAGALISVAVLIKVTALVAVPAIVVPALVALVISMLYVLPWYALWVLPTAAIRLRGRSTMAAWLVASALLVAYNEPPGFRGVAASSLHVGRFALPVVAVVLVILAAVGPFGRPSRSSHASGVR